MKNTNTAPFEIVAKTLFGLENILAEEIEQMGGKNIKVLSRAVSFSGNTTILYKANLHLRTAIKILMPIKEFKATDEMQLYKGIQQVNWEKFMSVNGTLAVESTVSSEYFNHTKYVALKTKDAIVDQFREKTGERPSVDIENPGLRINIRVAKDDCVVSLDSTGDPLFKRGYRVSTGIAPLNEVLAAGMVLSTGWRGDRTFIDPMCGSATILTEAGMIAADIAPGIWREHFAFQNWQDYDTELWDDLKAKAKAKIKPVTCQILGADYDIKVLESAALNLEKAGLSKEITLSKENFEDWVPPSGGGVMVTNPPYGERMSGREIVEFYKIIGDRLKKAYPGYDAWIISSNDQAYKNIGLRASKKMTLFNGALECKYLKFEMYRGTKR